MKRMFMVFGFALLSSTAALASESGVTLKTDSAAGEATFEVKFVKGAKDVTIDLSKGVLPADEVEVNGLSGTALTVISDKNEKFDHATLVELAKTTEVKTLKVALDRAAAEGDSLRIVMRVNDNKVAGRYDDLQVYGGININGNNNTVNYNQGYGNAIGTQSGGGYPPFTPPQQYYQSYAYPQVQTYYAVPQVQTYYATPVYAAQPMVLGGYGYSYGGFGGGMVLMGGGWGGGFR